jgi:hypothetical protein
MKTIAKLLLFILLLALPVAVRWFRYERATYKAPEIPQVSTDQIVLPTVAYNPYVDQPVVGEGRVILDLAHGNNLQIDDLTPLRERLSARGVSVQVYDGYSNTLSASLRGATALVVVSPTYEFGAEEQEAIRAFVEDGGRLLLAADPTRAAQTSDDYYDLDSIFFPTSAVPAANSLANAFGVAYFDDYLYSLSDNAGNYRNVQFSSFDSGQPLTQGLDTVVLFATHSLRGGDTPLLVGDAEIRSNVRTGESGLAAAVLAAEGRVLVMGDMTFLISPYHTTADNDHFLSNLADWLAVDARQWDLRDFPYLFARPVNVVQTFAERLTRDAAEHAVAPGDWHYGHPARRLRRWSRRAVSWGVRKARNPAGYPGSSRGDHPIGG